MQKFSKSTRIVRSPDFVFTDMDGDIVMMSVEQGEYFGIGGVGSRIWDLLDKEVSLEEVIDVIAKDYDVDASECERDLLEFVGSLIDSNLVKVC